MELLSPIDLTKGRPFFSLKSSVDASYIDPETGIKVVNNISMVDISEELKINEYAYASIAPIGAEQITYDLVKKFESVQNLLGKCVRMAEILNYELLTINKQLLATSENEEKEFDKLDFMKLRDHLFQYLRKNNLLKNIEKYNSNQKIKSISKLFFQFISDRNIYTHGILRMRHHQKDFVIEHKTTLSKNDNYSIVTIDILTSFFEAYEYLKVFLSDISSVINTKKKKS